MSNDSLEKINEEIISCRRCPRLIEYIRRVGEKKKKEFKDWVYWSKPVPGFGDPRAELMIIGLAPAAHGGNRTGRMFTGDSSGELLIKVLYDLGFANQPFSISKEDGLKLIKCYLSASIRCAPPNNKPSIEELKNCSEYLIRELKILKPKCIVLLGRIAYDNFFRIYEHVYGKKVKKPQFKHGFVFKTEDSPYVILSYHPSRRNVSTKRVNEEMFKKVFEEAKRILTSSKDNYQ